MTDKKNEPINFLPIPAIYITGASISTVAGVTRVTVFESDEHTGHARGCFVATDATWELIADLIRKQRELVAETAKSASAASDYNSQTRPN